MTKRDIVARLDATRAYIADYRKDDGIELRHQLTRLIADIEAPPTLPEGWWMTRNHSGIESNTCEIEADADGLRVIIPVDEGDAVEMIPIAAVRAALDLAEGGA